MSSRTRLGVLCVGWLSWVAAAASSTTTVDTATLRSMGLSRKEIKEVVSGEVIEEEEAEIIEEVDDEEEPWKSNEDWWKDPLSMFSDEEEEAETIPKAVKEEAPVVEEKIAEEMIVKEGIIHDSAVEEEIIDEPLVEEEIMEEEPRIQEEITEDLMVEEKIIEKPKEAPEIGTMMEKETEANPKEAPEIVTTMEKESEANIVERKSHSSSVASSLAMLVPLVPKIQVALSSAHVVQLAASAVVAKYMVESVMTKLSSSKKEEYLHDDDESSVSGDALEERRVPSDDDLDELVPVATPESTTTEATRTAASRRNKQSWVQGVGGIFTRTSDGRRIPPARDLLEQVESLRAHVTKVESERDIMEKEYEKASFQLQEAQTELATLTTTTRYLKAQLRDNEEAQDKAIRAERRKAKEELARMKEAMVGILNKERRVMRDELKRQTTELRSLLMEATGRDGEYASEGR